MKIKCALGLLMGFCIFLVSCNGIPESVEPSPTVTPTSTATPIPSPTFTFTPLPPMLSARSEVSCRAGPGDIYDPVETIKAGDEVLLVGRSELFWLVKTQTGKECWVADEQVNVAGEISALPIVMPPATPTLSLPAAPTDLKPDRIVCWYTKARGKVEYIIEFHLSWRDRSNNEDGFRIYRDGNLIAEVPANTTKLVDMFTVNWGNKPFFYYVVAYNSAGETKGEASAFGLPYCLLR